MIPVSFDIDASEYRQFAVVLGKIEPRFLDDVEGVVEKGSLNIKQDAAQRISGHPHLPHYPKSISYDIKRSFTTIEGEIGPDKGRMQGPLGNIIEYGTPNNPPIPHLAPALDEEEKRFFDALGRLFDNLLEG